MPKCTHCGRKVREVCGDGYCRACHVTCSWEDCVTKTFEARTNLRLYVATGISREEALKMVKETYPEARL